MESLPAFTFAELLGDDYKVVVKTYLHTDEDGKHNLVDMLNE